MRAEWRLPEQTVLVEPRHIDMVLVEYDEPEVVTVRDSAGLLYLSVASDESDEAIRWVQTRLSALELRALLAGGLSVRSALTKDELWVIDESRHDGHIIHAWIMSADEIPEGALPRPGALLPRATRSRLQVEHAGLPTLSIDGAAIRDNAISFRDMAAFAGSMQRLWTSLAYSVGEKAGSTKKPRRDVAKRSALSMQAAPPGSFAMHIKPADDQLFTEVAELFTQLAMAADDAKTTEGALREISPRSTSAYVAFLRMVEKHKLQVFAQWNDRASFLGHHTARRIRSTIERPIPLRRDVFAAFGHFRGFSYEDNKFTFHDLESDDMYTGSIAREFHERYTMEESRIAVGDQPYKAMLSFITRGGVAGETQTYELLDCALITGLPSELEEQ